MLTPVLNRMRYSVDILGPDGSTPLLIGMKAAIEDLTGNNPIKRPLSEEIDSSVSTHRITVRANALITPACYVQHGNELFISDYLADAGSPLRGRYTQIYARKVNDGKPAPTEYDIDGGTF